MEKEIDAEIGAVLADLIALLETRMDGRRDLLAEIYCNMEDVSAEILILLPFAKKPVVYVEIDAEIGAALADLIALLETRMGGRRDLLAEIYCNMEDVSAEILILL